MLTKACLLLKTNFVCKINLFLFYPPPPPPFKLSSNFIKVKPYCIDLFGKVSYPSLRRRIRPFSYSRYWTGTTLQLRLMRRNIIKKRYMSFAFEKTPRISLNCKLISGQNREYEYGVILYTAGKDRRTVSKIP